MAPISREPFVSLFTAFLRHPAFDRGDTILVFINLTADKEQVAAGLGSGDATFGKISEGSEGSHFEVVGKRRTGKTQALAQELMRRLARKRGGHAIWSRGVRNHHRAGAFHRGDKRREVELLLARIRGDSRELFVGVEIRPAEARKVFDAAADTGFGQAK